MTEKINNRYYSTINSPSVAIYQTVVAHKTDVVFMYAMIMIMHTLENGTCSGGVGRTLHTDLHIMVQGVFFYVSFSFCVFRALFFLLEPFSIPSVS